MIKYLHFLYRIHLVNSLYRPSSCLCALVAEILFEFFFIAQKDSGNKIFYTWSPNL